MKSTKQIPTTSLMLVLCLALAGCPNVNNNNSTRIVPPNQIYKNVRSPKGYNVWLADNTLAQLIKEIYKKVKVVIDIDKHVRKCPCGDNMINIDYPGLIFDGHAPVQVRTQGGQSGTLEMEGLTVSKNMEIALDEQEYSIMATDSIPVINRMKALESMINLTSQDTVKLAILDGGIDVSKPLDYLGLKPTNEASCLTEQYKKNNQPIPSKLRGFNFAPLDELPGGTPVPDFLNISDTHVNKHGTRVSYIASRQFNDAPKNLALLALRVLNNKNKGDSFGIICAMVSAKKLGAQILNMSLGYYGDKDDVFELAFNSLNDDPAKPIWIVMAAGNFMQGKDVDPSNNASPKNRDLGLRTAKLRFFPATFNNSSDNHLLTVTTVLTTLDGICIGQNYGNRFVDAGVKANNCNIDGGIAPIATNNPRGSQGTSFAAPAVAGWLGTQPNLSLPKNQILKKALIAIATPGPKNLSNFIRSGRYIDPK